MNNDIKINLPVGGVVTYQPTGLGGMEVTVTVPPCPPAFAPRATPLTIPITVGVKEPEAKPAPAPPPQTEAERLVDFAKVLPEAVWTGSGYIDPRVIDEDWIILVNPEDGGEAGFSVVQFRTILLGVMAAYVGTEPMARVFQWCERGSELLHRWIVLEGDGTAPDFLTAYRDCCLAIARKRGGA